MDIPEWRTVPLPVVAVKGQLGDLFSILPPAHDTIVRLDDIVFDGFVDAPFLEDPCSIGGELEASPDLGFRI